MKKISNHPPKRRTLTLSNPETVRELTTSQLVQIAAGQTGFGSLNTKSCNTCNLGF